MVNQSNIKKVKTYLIVIMSIILIYSNFIVVDAATLLQTGQVVTVTNNYITKSSVTVVGKPLTFNSGATYNVATLTDLKTQLGTAITNSDDAVTLNYTGSVAIVNYSTVLDDVVRQVMQTADNDYEKNILSSWSYSYTQTSPTFTVTYNFKYLETSDQNAQVKARVDQILNTIITSGMTDEQKEKAINDYICLNVAYDTSLVNHTAYAALLGNKKTVCQGYALLAYRMLTEAGIQARIVTGTVNGEGHAWNMVQINDSSGSNPAWYDLDVTWNDPVPDVQGRIRYDYFNLQDSQLKLKNHVWDATYYPTANTPYVTTDPQILSGGRSSDVVSIAPNVNNISVVNNAETQDTITVNGLLAGDIVNVYQDNSTKTPLVSGKIVSGKNSIIFKIKELGQAAGNVYISTKNAGVAESTRTIVPYAGEPVTAVTSSAISIVNNVAIPDTITFNNLNPKDTVKVYSDALATKLIGTGTYTGTTMGAITIKLTKQLDKNTSNIYVTVKDVGKLVSVTTLITYTPEVITSTLNSNSTLLTGKAIMVIGLNEKDVVLVYASDPTLTSNLKPIAKSTVTKGNSYVFMTFVTSSNTIYITNKSYNKSESVALAEIISQ